MDKGPVKPGCLTLFSRSVLSDSSVTPWTIGHQGALFLEFPRQEYWSVLPVSFSKGSSWLRDGTCVSCIAGGFFYY